jgi:cytochrome c556
MRRVLLAVALCAAPLITTANDAVEYRQNVLKAVGGHMTASAAIVRGQVPHRDQLIRHARSINEMAQIAPTLFPAGSDSGQTDALPAIWQQPERFQERLQAFQEAAARYHDVVANGEDQAAVGRAFVALGQACRNCHDNYRRN